MVLFKENVLLAPRRNAPKLGIWATSTVFQQIIETWDKYFKEGDVKRATIEEFNSDNTRRLNLEETKAKIASLEYIQNEFNGIPNIVKWTQIVIRVGI